MQGDCSHELCLGGGSFQFAPHTPPVPQPPVQIQDTPEQVPEAKPEEQPSQDLPQAADALDAQVDLPRFRRARPHSDDSLDLLPPAQKPRLSNNGSGREEATMA